MVRALVFRPGERARYTCVVPRQGREHVACSVGMESGARGSVSGVVAVVAQCS